MMSVCSIHRFRNYWAVPSEGRELEQQIAAGEDVVSRKNWNGHITASALVLSAGLDYVLMIETIKFGKLLLPGGHLEPGETSSEAALRELVEETGLTSVRPIKYSVEFLPIEINTHWIAANESRAEPKHRHHDFVYPFLMVEAHPENLVNSGESRSVGWKPIPELDKCYPKVIERIGIIKEQTI